MTLINKFKLGLAGLVLAGGIYGIYNLKNSSNEEQENKKNIISITSSDKTTQGKFKRTYRWDKILDEREEKYKIEKGLLKALAMRESLGDPLRLNESGDGGAGLYMFQPGTAIYCGLEVYGNSNKMGVDKFHGRELKKLYKRHNSWNKALSAYNRGQPAKNPDKTDHVKFIRQYQNYYNKRDKN